MFPRGEGGFYERAQLSTPMCTHSHTHVCCFVTLTTCTNTEALAHTHSHAVIKGVTPEIAKSSITLVAYLYRWIFVSPLFDTFVRFKLEPNRNAKQRKNGVGGWLKHIH